MVPCLKIYWNPFFTNINFLYQRSKHWVLSIKMFYVFKEKLYKIWFLLYFWGRVQLASKAGLVQYIVGNIQIYLALYFFTKFICCQEIFFYILARSIIDEQLLKVYTVQPILVKGLNEIMYSVVRQRNKTSHFFFNKKYFLIKI